MVFVDTNILIRLLTDDIPALRQRAEKMLQEYPANALFVPDIVLTELFFVLTYNPRYKLERNDICARLNILLEVTSLTISPAAVTALKRAARPPKLDFTDCLLAVYADNKLANLLTFDQPLQKILH